MANHVLLSFQAWMQLAKSAIIKMTLDLTSVHAKLRRAEEHAYTLEDDIGAWMRGNSYVYTLRANDDFTEHSIVIRRKTTCQIPSDRWALVLGDSVHNLRSALDHAVYSIAVFQTGMNPPPDDRILQFPICKGKDGPRQFRRFKDRFSRNILSAGVWAAIESVQPYNRQHPEIPPLLAILADFDNADKHRLLKLALASPNRIGLDFMLPGKNRATMHSYYGEIVDGTVIHSVAFERPFPDMKYDRIELEMMFTVWHGLRDETAPPWADKTEVTAFLKHITAEVRQIIDIVVAAA